MLKRRHLTFSDLPLNEQESQFVIEYIKDLNIARAAESTGIDLEHAYQLRERDDVQREIRKNLFNRNVMMDINPQWLMQEYYYLHLISMQTGKLSNCVACLREIGRLGIVDAYAPEKVELKGDKEIVDRLLRARKRFNSDIESTGKVIGFENTQDITDVDDDDNDETSFL